jgi:teichuronic acid biosynthesis glycosyltransferase TuaG
MFKSKITFAVIIPAYENNKFLYKTLLSVLKQKFKPTEVIIVDTSKKKINKSLVKDFNEENGANFHYTFFKNTKSEGRARNLASKKIKSNFISFLDYDDYWHIDYLKNVKNTISSKKNNYDIIFSQSNFINQKNKIIKKHKIPSNINIYDLYLYNPGTFTSNMVIKKETFFKVGMFDEKYGWNDKDILIKIINNNYKYFIIKKFLVYRRIHTNQISQNYFSHLKDNIFFFKKYYKNLSIKLRFIYVKKILFIFLKMIYHGIKFFFRTKTVNLF